MVDLAALRGAIDRHRKAGATWDQIADGIGVTSRSASRWALGGEVQDEHVADLVSAWLAAGAPVAKALRAGKRSLGVGLATPAQVEEARAILRQAHESGLQAKQIGRGLGVSDETVGWWLRGGGMTAESASTIRSWVTRGCPVPKAGKPGRKGRAVPTTPDSLIAAGALDPGVEWRTVAERAGATVSQVRYWAKRLGLALPARPCRGAAGRTGAPAPEPAPAKPTREQLAWLCRPDLPTSQWGLDVGDGVATPSRARACERAGWVEMDGPRSYRLTAEGRRLVDAEMKRRKLADLGWDAA